MKKWAYLAYSITGYLVFLATFLYLIGFVSGIGVPKNIDDGMPIHRMKALWINFMLIGLFVVQHTIMARPAFKKHWIKIVPPPIERSTFVLVTCAILILTFVMWQPVPEVVWQIRNPYLAGLVWTVCFAGWGIVLISTFLIDHFELFGINQPLRYFSGKNAGEYRFMARGFYRYVRHPLMFGFLLAFWAAPTMSAGHLFYALIYTVYVVTALFIEEKDLVRYHGEKYRSYQREVPMLIPGIKKRSVR